MDFKKALKVASYASGLFLLGLGTWSKLNDISVSTTVFSLSFGIILLCLPLIFWTYREGEGVQAEF